MLIIIVLLMRKYYTLVKNGRQEGVGAGNQEVSVLQPACKSDDAKDFLRNSRNFILFLSFIIIITTTIKGAIYKISSSLDVVVVHSMYIKTNRRRCHILPFDLAFLQSRPKIHMH